MTYIFQILVLALCILEKLQNCFLNSFKTDSHAMLDSKLFLALI